jgi:hypothetical protein
LKIVGAVNFDGVGEDNLEYRYGELKGRVYEGGFLRHVLYVLWRR